MSGPEMNHKFGPQDTSEEALQFEGDIPSHAEIPNRANILIISRDQSYLTHGIHKFPAKFFPELPRYLIRRYSREGDLVLDPMCGSGTTVLESVLTQRRGLGIDIDAMARLISKVKVTPLDPDTLVSNSEQLLDLIDSRISDRKYQAPIPEFNYRDNWFKPHVLSELGVIKASIKSIAQDDHIRDFFRVIMSSIIRSTSNADPHCTRTVLRKKVVKKIDPGDTITQFKVALAKQIEGMKELWSVYSSCDAWNADLLEATATDTGLDDESIDLGVTSPPYVNAVDYPRTHQLEMYWLDLLDDGPLSRVKRKYIGTETVYKKEYQDLQTTGYITLDPILKEIFQKDPRRSYITFRFFADMENQMRETYRILKPGARYCIVIGNNLIRGVQVKSHEILAEMAESHVGFTCEKMFFSKLIRHFIRIPRPERMLGEWVLILRK